MTRERERKREESRVGFLKLESDEEEKGMTPYRACDVELAARVSKLALSFSSQNIRLPLHQCIVSPLRLLPFFSSFLFLVAEQGSIYARRPPSSLTLSPSLFLLPLFHPSICLF